MLKLALRLSLTIVAGLLASAPASADDNLISYRITVVNRAGELLSVVCNDGSPIPLAVGARWAFTVSGDGDGATVSCAGYDHHGEPIAYASETLDHHHLTHTLFLIRNRR